MTIASLAAESDDLTILVRALEAADLTEVVADPDADLTVFAPSDAAFGALAVDLGFTGDAADADAVFDFLVEALGGLAEDGDPIPLLTDILLYHVSPGAKTSAEIARREAVQTALEGAEIAPLGETLVDAEPDLRDPVVETGDVAAENGVVHLLDRVLLPLDIPGNAETRTIAEIAAGNPDFDVLVRALEAADLTGAVADPEADLTVFAPTDAAFARLAADFGYDGDPEDDAAVFDAIAGALAGLAPDGDPIPLLTNILLYHVAPGARSAAEIAAADTVETLLEGASLTALGDALSDADPERANPRIALRDVKASNGSIQAVDGVLLPVDLEGDAPAETLADLAAGDPNFSLLLRAVEAATLPALASLGDPAADLTLFAPTNAAFTDLALRLGYRGDVTDEDGVFAAIVAGLTALAPDGDPIPLLNDVLAYHVSAGGRPLSALAAEGEVETLLDGAALSLEGATVIDAEPDFEDATVALADVAAANGVAQAIDRVLLPLDLPGTEGAPALVTGGAEADALAGDDRDTTFVGGPGGDRIALGGGANEVADLAANFEGDAISFFDDDDSLVFFDQRLAREDVTIAPDGSVSAGGASFTIDFAPEEGDFVAAGRDGGTVLSVAPFRAPLTEGVAVGSDAVNGVVAPQFLNGDTAESFSVAFEADAAARFDNAIGVYEVDETGALVDARLLAASVKAAAGTTVQVDGVEAGRALGFFLIQDGGGRFGETLDTADVFAFDTAGDGAPTLEVDGVALAGATVFFSTDADLNADGARHVLSGVAADGSGALQLGFEDKLRDGGSDDDFQDVLLTVEALTAEALA